MLVYFDIQAAPSQNTLHHTLKLHLQSTLGQLQMLLGPDLVVEFFLNIFERTIRLVRAFDNKRSLKFILQLSNKFCEEM